MFQPMESLAAFLTLKWSITSMNSLECEKLFWTLSGKTDNCGTLYASTETAYDFDL